jgi:hypothetical protein
MQGPNRAVARPGFGAKKKLTTRHHRPSPLEHTRDGGSVDFSFRSFSVLCSQLDQRQRLRETGDLEGGGRGAGGGARPQAAARLARTGRRIQAGRCPVVRTPQHTRPPDARSTCRRCRPDHQRSAPPIPSFVVICEDIL